MELDNYVKTTKLVIDKNKRLQFSSLLAVNLLQDNPLKVKIREIATKYLLFRYNSNVYEPLPYHPISILPFSTF